jgi:pyruvate, water dikinase
MEVKEIYWLDELSKDYRELVGNKCANLGELKKIGLRVPFGFAISTKAYEHFMEATGLKEEVSRIVEEATAGGADLDKDMDRAMDVSRRIRDAIEAATMPADLGEAIIGFYRRLEKEVGIPRVACAVRSSGAVSMPGQMETYLNVKGDEEIIEHVKKVWASAFTTRAIVFRLQNNMPVSWAPIGIAVIMMVDAKAGGAILTVLPNVGDMERAIVEGNYGLGESVVSGEITPDSFVVNKKDMIIESRSIGQKTKMVIFGDKGTVLVDVSQAMAEAPCIDDAEMLEIVRVAKTVEDYFGAPQDMEWVIDKRFKLPDSLFWVQARSAKYTKKAEGQDENYVIDMMLQLFRK